MEVQSLQGRSHRLVKNMNIKQSFLGFFSNLFGETLSNLSRSCVEMSVSCIKIWYKYRSTELGSILW